MGKNMCLICIIASLIFFGCSKKELNYTIKEVDGVKVYYNKSIPSDPSFKITPKEVFTIRGRDESVGDSLRDFVFPRSTVLDSYGNIYILDQKLSEIKKFDKNGVFLKSFCRMGTGPGELQVGIGLICLNDTLFVHEVNTKHHLKFTVNGEFLERILMEAPSDLWFVTKLDSERSLVTALTAIEKDNEMFLTYDLQIRDSRFRILKTLRNNMSKYLEANTNFLENINSYCVGKNKLYIAKISNSEYCIDVYDLDGNQLYRIRKDFRKIAMTDNEVSELHKSLNIAFDDKEKRELKINYKFAIDAMSMYEDKNGNLLVQVPIERNEENINDFVVDAFKDGVFINRLKMDIGRGYDFYNSGHQRFFIGDRIYYQNRDDNYVKVYEY